MELKSSDSIVKERVWYPGFRGSGDTPPLLSQATHDLSHFGCQVIFTQLFVFRLCPLAIVHPLGLYSIIK
jgi:hypothetical protein